MTRQKQAFEETVRRAFEADVLRGHDGVSQIVGPRLRYRVQKCAEGSYLVRVWGSDRYRGITELDEAAERRLLDGAGEVMSRKATNW